MLRVLLMLLCCCAARGARERALQVACTCACDNEMLFVGGGQAGVDCCTCCFFVSTTKPKILPGGRVLGDGSGCVTAIASIG
jgi:hypothetical protein